MKKFFTLFFILIMINPCAFAKKPKVQVIEGSGYVGTLPNVQERFQKSFSQIYKPAFESQDGFSDDKDIKPAPTDNPAFINIIMKKEKVSQYVKDLSDIIEIIEKLQTSIESNDSLQQFSAKSYVLEEEVNYFRDKYENKAESSFISYKKLMQLNTHVQAVASLRKDNETLSPYVTAAYSGNAFSANNIDNQLNYLLEEIKSTIVVLKETK